MIHGRYLGQGSDLSEVNLLRERIFSGNAPSASAEESGTGCVYDLRPDLDPMALNAIIDVDGKPVGTGRLILDLIEDRFYVDNIGILEEERGKGYGDFALRMLADKANQCAAAELWAEVPKNAAGFFEKHFFESEGSTGELILMKAKIVRFQSCCAAGQTTAGEGNGSLSETCMASCKQNGCEACSGCSPAE